MTSVTLSSDDALKLLVEPPPLGVSVVTITPEAAETFLSANTRNRNVSPQRVENLCRILRTAKWQLTPDAITIDADGLILNGQHRLAASVETGLNIEVLLYVGAEPSVRDVTDTGMKRTFAQVLSMHGKLSATNLAAATSLHYRFAHRLLRLAPEMAGGGYEQGRTQGNTALDHATLLQWTEDHPEIEESIRLVVSPLRHYLPHLKSSAASVIRALTFVIDPDECEKFMERIIKGENLAAGEPEYSFRNWVVRNGKAVNQVRTLAVGLKVWNARRENRTIQAVTFRSDERFPIPR